MIREEEVQKTDRVTRIARLAAERVGPEASAGLDRFVHRYFNLVSPDDILPSDEERLVDDVISIWELGRVRKPGNVLLRANDRSASDGRSAATVIEVINDDMPFLVDSTTAEINRLGYEIRLIIHPVLTICRDDSGERVEDDGRGTPLRESWMHIEIAREPDRELIDALTTSLERVLHDVRLAVQDWQPMMEQLNQSIAEIDRMNVPMAQHDVEETKEFLRWLHDDNFVFLGFRRYDFITEDGDDFLQIDEGSGLGILREVRPESEQRSRTPFTPEYSRFARRPELLIITKANHRSTVHRPVHMERIGVKRFDDDGRVVGEDRFLGLFTSTAYSRSVRFIPILREKVRRIVERAGLATNSHAGKALIQILESYPRDELFQATEDELFEISLGILQLQERQRIALFVRRDVFERFVSCLVYIPRDHYDSALRENVKTILEASFFGRVVAFYTSITDLPLARVHFIVKTTPGQIPDVDPRRIEALIAEAARNWSDHLRDALVRARGEDLGLKLYRRYAEAFPAGYRERFSATTALGDIDRIEECIESRELVIDLYERPSDERKGALELRCKFIHPETRLTLSDIVPRLENAGFRVEMAVPYEIEIDSVDEPIRIRDFSLVSPFEVQPSEIKETFEEAFLRAWRGDAEEDGFSRLVIAAGLRWHEVALFRAYAKYLRQTGITYSETSMQHALAANREITLLLLERFRLLLDPSLDRKERARAADTKRAIVDLLEDVDGIEDDAILRRFLNLIDSTLRTNYFQRDERGERKRTISFKFDSAELAELPLPRPQYEIFVYSPRFEGIHLRAGKVARGGLRWSDRREDFRTEILGLMKAQVVKNAVIVPVGAKGGFVLKKAPSPSEREAFLDEGVACYRDFLRGLLDLTDNLDGDAIIPPPDLVRRDGDDPYLVVAADKGTATFSDYANAISKEYGFWLGDAFASGGSVGYDHKKMGITARGAWEAVKRHFRELGKDIQREAFTVVGVGDMSGDVFGNGMLLSKQIRLLGAFNHLHIFVDPDPDPERSWNERMRLFELSRSSWSDYDRDAMSDGGAVYDRSAKSITVSERVAEVFGLETTTTTPNDLIRAILKADVELLWFGGIGTYVKASDETDAEARDRTNDPLRVDAADLRARVIGEGANLAITQRGRVEFATEGRKRPGGGGRINTDAIDNSAGVDTSDHEVNIKILLDDAVRHGTLTDEARVELLAGMTDEVAALVLRDNYQQTQAISVVELLGAAMLDPQARLMRTLERQGRLNRTLEALPDDEGLAERQAEGEGLTRPEIAVLLSWSKISLYQELIDSDLPEDPLLRNDLVHYFPKQLHQRFATEIERHRLRREIILTHLTNSVVNRMGPSFVFRVTEETGQSAGNVVRAYVISRESFSMKATWAGLEALDNEIPAALQLSMLEETSRLLERTTRWFLRNFENDLDITRQQTLFGPSIAALEQALDRILPPPMRRSLERREAMRREEGLPQPLARRMASLDLLGSFPDIVRIATDIEETVDEVGHVYFEVGARFEFDRLRTLAGTMPAESHWQRSALEGVIDDLFASQSLLVTRVLRDAGPGARLDSLDLWLEPRHDLARRTDQLLSDLLASPSVDLTMMGVAARHLRILAASS